MKIQQFLLFFFLFCQLCLYGQEEDSTSVLGATYTGPFKLTIKFDYSPREIWWEIRHANGNATHSKGYSSGTRAFSTVIENETIPAGNNYTFTMHDRRGDGLCCTFGSGYYRLTDRYGRVVASGSRFGSRSSRTFNVASAGCGPPTNVRVSNVGSRATINWNAVSGASYYQVSYQPYRGRWRQKNVGSNSTTIGTLVAGTYYRVAVRTRCNSSNSYSKWVYSSFFRAPSVVTCADLSISSLAVSSQSSSRISYRYTTRNRGNGAANNIIYRTYLSTNTIPDKYDILIDTHTGSPISANRSRTTSRTRNIPNVNLAVRPYIIIVVSSNSECGNKRTNNTRANRYYKAPIVQTCSKPTNLRTNLYKKTFFGFTTKNTATFSWNKVYGAVWYQVKYRKHSSNKWSYGGTWGNTYRINVSSKTNYVWYVRSRCSGGRASQWTGVNFRSLTDDEDPLKCKDLTISDLKITSRTNDRIDYRYTIMNEGADTIKAATVLLKGLLSDDEVHGNAGDVDAGSSSLIVNLTPGETMSGTLGVDIAIDESVHNFLLLKIDPDDAFKNECDEQNNENGVPIGGTCISPDNLSVSNIDAESATLNWTATSGADAYELSYSPVDEENWQTIIKDGTSHNLSDLADSTSYTWVIRTLCDTLADPPAFSELVYGGFTTTAGLFINSDGAEEIIFGSNCETPRELTESEITDNSTLISWNTILDATAYDIRYRIAGADDEEVEEGEWTTITDILDTSYPLTELTPETNYEWEVRTQCAEELPSEWGASSFTTIEDDCLSSNFTQVNDTPIPSKVHLGADIISTGTVETGSKVVMEATNTITLKPGFEAQDDSEFHAYLANCSLSEIVPEPTEVDQRVLPINSEVLSEQKTQLEVFPNPLQQEASIRFYLPTESAARILIFDLNGQLLTEQTADSSKGWNTTRLNATELPAGMYYVTLQTSEGVLTKKVMIVK